MPLSFLAKTAQALVPGPFREFIPYVSPSALHVIHKNDVLALAVTSAQNVLSHSRYEEAVARIRPALTSKKIKIVESISTPVDSTLPPEIRKAVGSLVLELYFTMIHAPVPFFLDLRPHSFGWDEATGTLLWKPSRLFSDPSPEFRRMLISLYAGFFNDDPEATAQGLSLYNWKTTCGADYYARVETLMRQHFGDARSTAVIFEMEHFRSTFHTIFDEAIRSKARFHPELTLIGTALAGMYVTLEMLKTPFDVAAIYRNV